MYHFEQHVIGISYSHTDKKLRPYDAALGHDTHQIIYATYTVNDETYKKYQTLERASNAQRAEFIKKHSINTEPWEIEVYNSAGYLQKSEKQDKRNWAGEIETFYSLKDNRKSCFAERRVSGYTYGSQNTLYMQLKPLANDQVAMTAVSDDSYPAAIAGLNYGVFQIFKNNHIELVEGNDERRRAISHFKLMEFNYGLFAVINERPHDLKPRAAHEIGYLAGDVRDAFQEMKRPSQCCSIEGYSW